jgi:hypothetical protein
VPTMDTAWRPTAVLQTARPPVLTRIRWEQEGVQRTKMSGDAYLPRHDHLGGTLRNPSEARARVSAGQAGGAGPLIAWPRTANTECERGA